LVLPTKIPKITLKSHCRETFGGKAIFWSALSGMDGSVWQQCDDDTQVDIQELKFRNLIQTLILMNSQGCSEFGRIGRLWGKRQAQFVPLYFLLSSLI
jgi:hypothetical protein